MNQIIYYIASSLDGYIADKNNDVTQFISHGKGVEKCLMDLTKFETVIMGRKTYEFAFQYGLKPGQPAYPHMTHHIFSDTLNFDHISDQVHLEKLNINRIKEIKKKAKTDIYLCGGGHFAGWLLENRQIDQLKLKLNPVILREGVKLFGASKINANWKLIESESFSEGLHVLTFNLKK